MDTIKSLHNISANIFFCLALIYIASALALRNDLMSGNMIFLMRLLDIPFAFTALLYGGSGLYLQLTEGKEDAGSAWGIIIFAICLILFGAVVFVNFAFPSQL